MRNGLIVVVAITELLISCGKVSDGEGSADGGSRLDAATADDGSVAMECGNAVLEGDEECDLGGATTTCSMDCATCDPPSPTVTLDQQLAECSSPPVTQCNSSWSLANGQSVAQGFMPTSTGLLDGVELNISNESPASHQIVVSIVGGGDDPTSLASMSNAEILANTLAEDSLEGGVVTQWQRATFNPPLAVQANQTYFILVRLTGANDGTRAMWRSYNYWQDEMVDSYPRGRAFSCGSGCPSFILEPDVRDREFRTYMTEEIPICTATLE